MSMAKTNILKLLILLFVIVSGCTDRKQKELLSNLDQGKSIATGIKITYPANATIFPPEFQSPTFEWYNVTANSSAWYVYFTTVSGELIITKKIENNSWKPDSLDWKKLKTKVKNEPFYFTVIAKSNAEQLPCGRVQLKFSKDSVGADIFFRAVTLPFGFAVKNVHTIEWYLGSVKGGHPRKMLDKMTVCANCHTFSGDGSLLAMDVDYGNDKGSYTIAPTKDTCKITPDKIITWSDYKRDEGEPTFGLLSQISPDGRYVLSTVKDLSVFVAIDNNLAYSQLFFPIKGILGIYDRKTKTFSDLPGANDKKLVQSNANWSPDGKKVVFARTTAYTSQRVKNAGRALLSIDDVIEFKKGKQFKYDLYTVDFNNGHGGIAQPLKGGSGNGKSNYFARYSPDGKWIVFCQASNYMLLRPDSRLYIMPSSGGVPRLMNCNLDSMNSWHSWSPNSKWIVFSSKHRGIYTQLYLTHIDENGNDSPPVLLENLLFNTRAANIPEFFPGKADNFKKIQDAFSQTAPSYAAIASDNITNKYYKRAWDNLQKALQIDSNYIDAYYSRILLNAQLFQINSKIDRSDKNKMLELTKEKMGKNKNDVHLHILHATLISSLGDNKAAIEEAKSLLQIAPDKYPVYEFIVSVLRKMKDYQATLPYYEKMQQLVPVNKPEIMFMKAQAYIALKKLPLALDILNDLIKIDTNDYNLYASRAGINLDYKNYTEALKDCDYILSKDKDNAQFHQLRAQVYSEMGNKRNAYEDYQTALDLIGKKINKNPEDISLLFERASQLNMLGNSDEAMSNYNKVLNIFPFNYEALKEKARIQITEQQWNEAIKTYEQLSQNYPDEEEFYNNQAIAYLNLGNHIKALDELNKTIQIDGKNCDALYNRSKLEGMMGNNKDAQTDLQLVIKILTDKKNHGQLNDKDIQWLNSLKQQL
jgi:tetratricopeptide (TPR) repeat protein